MTLWSVLSRARWRCPEVQADGRGAEAVLRDWVAKDLKTPCARERSAASHRPGVFSISSLSCCEVVRASSVAGRVP